MRLVLVSIILAGAAFVSSVTADPAPSKENLGKKIGNAFSNPELAEWVAGQGAKDVVLI